VAEVHAALALAGEPGPVAQPQRGRDGLLAHAVLLGAVDQLDPRRVGAQPAVGQPVGVVGVDQQPAHAVGELLGDRPVHERRVPARQRGGHRVVRGRQRDLGERPVAQLGVPVAGTSGRGGGRGDPRAHEHRDGAADQQGRDGAGRERAAAPRRARRPLPDGRTGPVDHPQQLARPGRDQQHAGDAERERDHGVAGEEARESDDQQRHRTRCAQRRSRGLGRDRTRRTAHDRAHVERPQQRRRRGRDDGARAGEDPRRGAQVGEERVPHRRRGVALLRALDGVERDGAPERVEDHEHEPRDRDRAAERDGRGAAVAGQRERPGGAGHGHREQQPRQQPDAVGRPDQVSADGPGVAREQADVLGAPQIVGQLRSHRLDRAREHHADVAQRQGQRVLVAVDQRAVHVAHGGPEDARDRAAADDAAGDGLDHGPHGDQVGLLHQHLVGHAGGEQRADGRVLERRRRAVGELVRVHDRVARVARHERQQRRECREQDEDPGEEVATHGRRLTARRRQGTSAASAGLAICAASERAASAAPGSPSRAR
jgi:hypothetical protein